MKQILQNLKTGKTELVEVPVPGAKSVHIVILTRASLVSAGTERMLVEFGKANLLDKARQQPEKVKQALEKIRTDGLMPTIDAVRSKLDHPIPLGYSNVGHIVDASFKFEDLSFKVEDRVVSNGPHAEVVCVPKNLCAKIPDTVSDEEAAFTVVGAIALQGIRLAQPTLGEIFVVTGLGLIGQLTVQLLIAHGCRVLGIDIDSKKCDLARQFGAETVDLSKGEDPLEIAMRISRGQGVDGVLITAATKSSEPMHQAAQMCRKRGRIVLIGVTGLELQRADFYEKELSFQVSCSYGPGRYDPEYEKKGHDYPLGYVRWTEQRNFEAVLDLMASGKLDVKPLISHRFPFEEALKAYDLISGNKEPYIGIILEYQGSGVRGQGLEADVQNRTVQLKQPSPRTLNLAPQAAVIGFIGAGNFTGQVLLPALRKTGVRLKTIASSGGVSATHLGKKFVFEECTTDTQTIFADPEINTVFITTRHNTHAGFAIEAIKAGKNVFVEKPLCLNFKELDEIQAVLSEQDLSFKKSDKNSVLNTSNLKLKTAKALPLLMVGFNRRFAPHVIKIKKLLESVKEPKSMVMTVNAGFIPPDHWIQDPEVGGGRIIGEACHFIDLLRFLAGKEITSSEIVRLNKGGMDDTVTIQLSFGDGSIGTIHYFTNGNRRFPKERLEVFVGQRILHLDNFKTLRGYGWKGFKKMKLWRQDKGHNNEIRSFIDAITKGKSSPISFEEIVEVTKTSIDLSVKK